jgi:hypothetical protein
MTGMSDTAAEASIGAATRELRLPVVRAEASRMAEAALRDRVSHLGYLADVLAAEVDERAERRRTRRVTEARFPRLRRRRQPERGGRRGVPARLVHLPRQG